jgi:hypothetical protein
MILLGIYHRIYFVGVANPNPTVCPGYIISLRSFPARHRAEKQSFFVAQLMGIRQGAMGELHHGGRSNLDCFFH